MGAFQSGSSSIRFRLKILSRFWCAPMRVSSSSIRRFWVQKTCAWIFLTDGIRRLAEVACLVNEKTETIGARRLYTVIEKLLEEVSFTAGQQSAPNAVTIYAQ